MYKKSISQHSGLKEFFSYLIAVCLCIFLLFFIMKLWNAEPQNLFFYPGGDGWFHGMLVKGMIDNNWFLHNRFIGMPIGLKLYDFPVLENLHMIILKAVSIYTNSYALTINIYFVSTFILTTIFSMFVFRHFKFSRSSSIVGSLLYAFLPYHFMRNCWHIFLASYYMVPLAIMVAIWIYNTDLFFQRGTGSFFNFRSIVSIVVSLLVASSGIYYAFFMCFLLFVAGATASLNHKKICHLSKAGILILIIIIGLGFNAFPNIIHKLSHDGNKHVLLRPVECVEIYGLKISQMLFPIDDHRLSLLAHFKDRYNYTAPLINENTTASLGIIGSIGFLILLAWIFYRKDKKDGKDELVTRISLLNMAAVLFGTIGGFGAIFGYIFYSKVRCYNRISIYIVFFSIAAFLIFFERMIQNLVKKKIIHFPCILFIFILVLGVWDQTANNYMYAPDYESVKKAYKCDLDFVKKIEASVPRYSMIFQLPYVPFPEAGPTHKMFDYDHFRGYLNSNRLRWSYGAMRGGEADLWQRSVISKPLDEFLSEISKAGFKGIYIDRRGYEDGARDLETRLIKKLKEKPITSADGLLLFFTLP